jgi:AraC family transcriptional regulator
MKTASVQQIECNHSPVLSSRKQGWENILVQQFQHPSGEGTTYFSHEHTICLSLAPRPVRFLQIKGGKTHSSIYGKGDISITPAQVPFFARWQGDDCYLEIRIASDLIQTVANETFSGNTDRLELRPEFRFRDPQLEAIGLMLLSELERDSQLEPSKLGQEHSNDKLYVDSLTNVLAVHLLRHYSTTQPHFSTYPGGLPEPQLLQVLDYIHYHLNQPIKLADLATLLNISPFHFSHLFKQSMGIAPYQYLLQQRIERAKQLLKQTDRSITEIALLCGFNSHSHLSKQFRQITTMTPNTYRRIG